MQRAAAAFAARDWAQAEKLCRQVLAESADQFDALSLLGVIRAQGRHLEEAALLLARAVAARPGHATAHHSYGNVLRDLGRLREAVDQYDRALELEPRYAEACNGRGGALHDLGDLAAALASYERALALRPDYAEAHYCRAVTLHDAGHLEEAVASYERAVRLQPRFWQAHYNRGIALYELRRLEEAVRSYDLALQAGAGAEACNNRGNSLFDLGHREEALRSYDRALELNPALADAHNNRGNVLRELKRPEEALASYARALAISPHLDWLPGAALHTRLLLCDWSGIDAAIADVTARMLQGGKATRPFTLLAVCDDPAVQRRAAEISSADSERLVRALPAPARHPARETIRIGYYSADFDNHAMAQLMVGLFERHNRRRFEINAFSCAPHRHDDMTQRLRKAFDRFMAVGSKSDREVAQLSRDLGIDIAVDLKGFTQEARPGIFVHRAAPLQVSYLGYPGTSGARYIDYLIADSTVIPPHTRPHYSEKLILLPHCYFPNSYRHNDQQRLAPGSQPSRAELGLPECGFVFCCFNSVYKILPATFAVWMQILRAVDGSVLWLLTGDPTAARNLRTQAERRGISGSRIILAPPLSLARHMPRHLAADLFLDTFPCGAHTTATDALWAGLPVLTRPGDSLASRVGSSLLRAIGLPELVVSTPEQYEALAVALATEPERMAAIRNRLEAHRLTTPLFDTQLLTRQLEHGYRQIYRRYHSGLGPEDVQVPADPPAEWPTSPTV